MTTDYNRYIYGSIGYDDRSQAWYIRDEFEGVDREIPVGKQVNLGMVSGVAVKAVVAPAGDWQLINLKDLSDLLPSRTYGGVGGMYAPVEDDLML